MGYVRFSFNCFLQPADFNLSRKGNRNISFSFLNGETFNGRTNCEKFWGAKGCELMNLSDRDLAESGKESCTALLNIHLNCVPVIIQCFISLCTELCQYIVHSFCRQFTFHTDWSQLKWPFVFITQIRSWKDTRRQLGFYSVCF